MNLKKYFSMPNPKQFLYLALSIIIMELYAEFFISLIGEQYRIHVALLVAGTILFFMMYMYFYNKEEVIKQKQIKKDKRDQNKNKNDKESFNESARWLFQKQIPV